MNGPHWIIPHNAPGTKAQQLTLEREMKSGGVRGGVSGTREGLQTVKAHCWTGGSSARKKACRDLLVQEGRYEVPAGLLLHGSFVGYIEHNLAIVPGSLCVYANKLAACL